MLEYPNEEVMAMGIRFQTDIKINLKAILKDCVLLVPEEEVKREIRAIVRFWAERRMVEDGWPLPGSSADIREHLLENQILGKADSDPFSEELG